MEAIVWVFIGQLTIVLVPIAGIILASILVVELYRAIIEKKLQTNPKNRA